MMWILGIALIAGMKTLLCKGFALGIFTLLFWLKGRALNFNSRQWDDFFLHLSVQTVRHSVMAVYLISAAISSFISYFLLSFASYRHGLEIAVLLFLSGLSITACKWHTKGNDYLLNRYRELQTALYNIFQPTV